MKKKYPHASDITLHKDKVWQMLLLMFKTDCVTEKDVEIALRNLAGDAALWVYNNCELKDKEEYLAKAKQTINNLKVKVEP